MAEHPLACEEWRRALAGWVVAQLDPDEEAALLAHLAGCRTCRGEAAGLLDVAAVALSADLGPRAVDDVALPADLGARVLARVARERRARWAGRSVVAMAAAAAAVVTAVVATRDAGPERRAEEVVFAREADGVDASAVVADDGAGSVVLLSASGLDPEVTYTLWLTPPGGGYPDRREVGTFRADGAGNVQADLDGTAVPLEAIGRVWVTTPDGEIALDTTEPGQTG